MKLTQGHTSNELDSSSFAAKEAGPEASNVATESTAYDPAQSVTGLSQHIIREITSHQSIQSYGQADHSSGQF